MQPDSKRHVHQPETEISSVLGLAKDGDELLLMAPSVNNWFCANDCWQLRSTRVRRSDFSVLMCANTCCVHRGSVASWGYGQINVQVPLRQLAASASFNRTAALNRSSLVECQREQGDSCADAWAV